ncbi:MAG: hypothetical protein KC621_21250 [Myxococcales bacterium]|nr:hypothetical protein [Myxococcales bacterium]
MLLSAVLLACDGSTDTPTDVTTPTDSTETGVETTGDTGDTGGTTTIPPDPPDMMALTRSLQASIDVLPRLGMRPCYEAWRQASVDQEVICPQYSTVGTTLAWETACTTAGGTSYSGLLTTSFEQSDYISTYVWEDVVQAHASEVMPSYPTNRDFEGTVFEGIGMDGTVTVFWPGETDNYLFGGQGQSTTFTRDGLTVRYHKVEGLCRSKLPVGGGGTWVDDELDPWLTMDQMSRMGSTDRRTHVNGSLYGLPSPYDTVSYEDLVYRPTSLGGACDLEPSGVIELRENDGHYWRITFDGTACDGCGDLTSEGFPFGEACATFTPMAGPLAETDVSDLLPINLPSARLAPRSE